MKFPKLFSPIKISKLELPNRIVYSPCGTGTTINDGYVSDRMVDLYAEYGAGGAALICVEDSMVHPVGKRSPHDPNFYDDSCMEGMRRIAEAIKKGGAKAAIHLSHGGRSCRRWSSEIPVSASAVAMLAPGSVVPRELTIEEILELEDKYAEAALRARQVGFDVVWLHGAHRYLIMNFLSPMVNKRQDAYGGDHARRFRFLAEIIQKVKQKIGEDFPLMLSINGIEIEPGGLTLEDARQNARLAEAAGIHAIRISMGDNELLKSPAPGIAPQVSSFSYIPLYTSSPMRTPRGYLVHMAAAVKEMVSIPIMTQGRIITPQEAERYLEEGKLDLVGIARGLFADPEWPRKAQEGREREIRHCISCKYCSPGRAEHAISCVVNPRYAREAETKITPATKIKTVFVAGGGPAGLEAARVAALRGHKVTLYEKDKLGGQINLSCVPPGKGDVKLFVDYEKVQMELLGVKIKNEELTLEKVKRAKPDAVVVATGAHPAHPDFPGSHNENVVTAWQVLDGSVAPKGKVVVLGGRVIGAETAEYLASKGNEVTIVEESAEIARDSNRQAVWGFLLISLRLLGVNMLTKTAFERVTKSGVKVKRKGESFSIPADTVVLALGNEPNGELASQLKNLGIELHVVGDCTGVGKMVKAIKQGFQAGIEL